VVLTECLEDKQETDATRSAKKGLPLLML